MDDAKTYVSANYMLLAAVLLVIVAGIYFLLSRPRQTGHRIGAVIMSRPGKAPEPPVNPHQFGDVWYYADHTGQVGPFSFNKLKARVAWIPDANNVFVWGEGMSEWQKVVAIPELNRRIKRPPLPRVKTPRDYSELGRFIPCFLVLIAVVSAVGVLVDKGPSTPLTPEQITCRRDYTKCQNNEQMINDYSKMSDATVKCKTSFQSPLSTAAQNGVGFRLVHSKDAFNREYDIGKQHGASEALGGILQEYQDGINDFAGPTKSLEDIIKDELKRL
jgi:GYF domain 2